MMDRLDQKECLANLTKMDRGDLDTDAINQFGLPAALVRRVNREEVIKMIKAKIEAGFDPSEAVAPAKEATDAQEDPVASMSKADCRAELEKAEVVYSAKANSDVLQGLVRDLRAKQAKDEAEKADSDKK